MAMFKSALASVAMQGKPVKLSAEARRNVDYFNFQKPKTQEIVWYGWSGVEF